MSEKIITLLADSFWKILLPGITATIPLTIISFTLALIIATVTALVQFARVPVLTPLARFYIWIIRGTPLLVQLFVIFFGLPRIGVVLEPFRLQSLSLPSIPARMMQKLSGPHWSPSRVASWKPENVQG